MSLASACAYHGKAAEDPELEVVALVRRALGFAPPERLVDGHEQMRRQRHESILHVCELALEVHRGVVEPDGFEDFFGLKARHKKCCRPL
jgi:hypothetical protein